MTEDDFYRTLDSEMKDPETWRIEEEYRTRRGSKAVAAFADRIAAEDAAAPALLEELLRLIDRDPAADVTKHPHLVTGGVVRAFQQLMLEQRVFDPFLVERLASVGCDLAEALPDDYYPGNAVFDLRGRAWILRCGSASNLDRGSEAFEYIDRAERAYEHLADPGAGLAAVKLSRAIAYLKLGRYSDALPFAKAAAEEYKRRRDMYKYAEAIETAAAILYAAGEYGDLVKMYSLTLEIAERLHENEMRARAAHGLGVSHRKLGDLDKAGQYLLEALHMWEALEMRVPMAQSRWSIGLLALARADFHDAEKVLRSAIDALQAVGAEQSVADAKLDLAEVLLMLGRPQEIEALCAEAEAYYARVGLMTGRLAAARFLRNAAANQMLRREDVQHVRTYLEQSREKPETPFAPPRRNGPGSGH